MSSSSTNFSAKAARQRSMLDQPVTEVENHIAESVTSMLADLAQQGKSMSATARPAVARSFADDLDALLAGGNAVGTPFFGAGPAMFGHSSATNASQPVASRALQVVGHGRAGMHGGQSGVRLDGVGEPGSTPRAAALSFRA